MRYGNQFAIPLPLAVFLATDDYDYDPTAISTTTLMKPIRQWVLAKRVSEDTSLDIAGLVSSRMGSAIHAAIERAWQNPTKALQALGIPSTIIQRIVINPTPESLALLPNAIPVYMEQRAYKQVGKHRVSGKFDFVAEGRVQDFKSTSTFKHLKCAAEMPDLHKIMVMSEAQCRAYYVSKYGTEI